MKKLTFLIALLVASGTAQANPEASNSSLCRQQIRESGQHIEVAKVSRQGIVVTLWFPYARTGAVLQFKTSADAASVVTTKANQPALIFLHKNRPGGIAIYKARQQGPTDCKIDKMIQLTQL
jgi:hypothetical protein